MARLIEVLIVLFAILAPADLNADGSLDSRLAVSRLLRNRPAKTYVVAIGTDNFLDRNETPSLRGAESDAKTVAALFADPSVGLLGVAGKKTT